MSRLGYRLSRENRGMTRSSCGSLGGHSRLSDMLESI